MSFEPVSVKNLTRASARRAEASSGVGQPVTPERKRAVSAGAVGRHIVLAIFLLYCLLPATWIIVALTKDNGQIFSTFGLWFSYPFHVFENLFSLVTYQDGIFVRWFGNSLIYAGSISFGSTLICALGGFAFSKYDFPG